MSAEISSRDDYRYAIGSIRYAYPVYSVRIDPAPRQVCQVMPNFDRFQLSEKRLFGDLVVYSKVSAL